LNSAKSKDYRKDKPVNLIISDEGRGKYYYDLKQYCGVTSNRVERILASLFAKQILLDKFDENGCINKDVSLSEFQSSGGGLRQVKWGNSDLETTLWAVYIDPTKFNKEELIKYFESYINNGGGNGADGILANWGLSILGKPQINNLKVLSNKSTTFKEKILSALALNYVGENETAKELYYDLLGYYAYVNKPYIRIQGEIQDMNSYILNTSYMLLLSSKINSEYDKGMSLYLRDYRTDVAGIILEVANISFINSELQKLPKTDTEAVVKSKYQNKTLELTKGGSITSLKSDELDGSQL
jgi:hypothetical protein